MAISFHRTSAVCFALLMAWWPHHAFAATNAYCSSENTGSDFSPVYSIYQSMGSCSKTCRDSYAFAVLQGKDCWCSNYIPAQQENVYSCSSPCPGFPSDWCGNPTEGLYGYVALNKAPSGTAGGSSQQPQSTSASQAQSSATQPAPSPSSSTTSSSDPAPTSIVSKTVYQTKTEVTTDKPSVVTSYVTPTVYSTSTPPPPSSSSFSSSTPLSSSSTSSSRSSTHATTIVPIIHTSVITQSGSVVTRTVTSTPTALPGSGQPDFTQLQRKGLSGGAIAGAVVGSLLGLAGLALAAFLLWRRRKPADAEDQDNSSRFKRTTSVLSRTGLLSRGRPQSMAEGALDADNFNGGNSVRHSVLFGAGAAGAVEPSSPLEGSQDDSGSRRLSRPLVYDQRLNPSALFANAEANGSRVSMQDQQDYSRPLGVINPDARASFDSR